MIYNFEFLSSFARLVLTAKLLYRFRFCFRSLGFKAKSLSLLVFLHEILLGFLIHELERGFERFLRGFELIQAVEIDSCVRR